MKKLLAILTTLVLILGLSSVLAAGASDALPELGGGLPSLQGGLPSVLAPIPDPAESLGSTGSAYQTGYSYSGKTYDLYLYSKPDTADAFIEAYTKAAAEAGYKVTKGTETGNDALYITEGDTKAILLYDYQGYMMLMVPEGADFTLRETVKPTPAPEPRKNRMSLDYNGYHYESTMDALIPSLGIFTTAGDLRFASDGFTFDAPCPFGFAWLAWPASAHAGDVIKIKASDGMAGLGPAPEKTYVSLTLDDEKVIDAGKFNDMYYLFSSGSDYFTLTITKSEKTDEGYLFEGTFEGVICSNMESKKIEIKNGFFSVCG